MSDETPPSPQEEPSREDLDARLRAAKAKRGGAGQEEPDGGLAFAVRIGVDLVAALIVGVGIGIALDRWFETSPWFLVLFFLLGAAAGMMNVYRVMAGYGYAAGYKKLGRDRDKDPDRKPNGR